MQTLEKAPYPKPFKQRKSFVTRKQEVAGIRSKFPTKVPVRAALQAASGERPSAPRSPHAALLFQVIIERYPKEKFLPPLDKTKFLVPQELSMSQFVTIIRNRMSLLPSQAFYLLIDNHGLTNMSLTMAQVYKEHRDDDGFLYMTYASQEMFGTSVQLLELNVVGVF
ncbi:microtubule-associated proteins 1A/1B light chain 3C-like [Arapaima gigas]